MEQRHENDESISSVFAKLEAKIIPLVKEEDRHLASKALGEALTALGVE